MGECEWVDSGQPAGMDLHGNLVYDRPMPCRPCYEAGGSDVSADWITALADLVPDGVDSLDDPEVRAMVRHDLGMMARGRWPHG